MEITRENTIIGPKKTEYATPIGFKKLWERCLQEENNEMLDLPITTKTTIHRSVGNGNKMLI